MTRAGGARAGVPRAPSSFERIYAAVRRIPRGKVSTYGAVARLAGMPGRARQVGYALAALRDGTAVPWHRVVNARGVLSLERAGAASGLTQRVRLAREGVTVDGAGRVALARFGWRVRDAEEARRARD